MIAHQNPRMHPPAEARASPLSQIHPRKVVLIILENGLPAVPARHHMIYRAGCLISQRSGYKLRKLIRRPLVNARLPGLTPSTMSMLVYRD